MYREMTYFKDRVCELNVMYVCFANNNGTKRIRNTESVYVCVEKTTRQTEKKWCVSKCVCDTCDTTRTALLEP